MIFTINGFMIYSHLRRSPSGTTLYVPLRYGPAFIGGKKKYELCPRRAPAAGCPVGIGAAVAAGGPPGAGEEAFSQGIAAGVLAQAAGVVWLLAQAWGWPGALRAGFGIVGLTWLAEFGGSSWGFPFGQYHYSTLLQPQILGVPLWIPLAWLMMLPPAWAVAAALLESTPTTD